MLEFLLRIGAPFELVAPQSRLRPVLQQAMQKRCILVSVVLFGCLRASGSTYLSRLDSSVFVLQRRAIAEYAGIDISGAEFRRLCEVQDRLLSESGY